MDERKIIELYWTRNEEAIQQSINTYGSYCRTVAAAILNDPADVDEAVADTWLNAWNAIPPQRPACLRLFLGKITRNLSLSIWRKHHAKSRGSGEIPLALEELGELLSAGPSPEDAVNTGELAQCITVFLRKEPERRRIVFLRRYFYLESIDTIAKGMEIKEANVRMILSRTRQRLKEHLTKEGFLP